MSLPTPPRTQKRKRARRSMTPDADADSSDDERASRTKKRKTTEDEDAFWMARGLDPVPEDEEMPENAGEDAPLLFRKLQGTTGAPPMSPPPSHRKVVRVRATKEVVETKTIPEPTTPTRTPVTPTRRRSPAVTPKPRAALRRDSPENPFLESPSTPTPDSASSAEGPVPSAAQKESNDLDERPMLTYVYRGTKRQFPNPHWNHAENRARSPDPRSLLDPRDPDFVPDMRLAPKILFPQARKGKGRATVRSSNKRKRTPQPVSESEDDDERDTLRPVKLDFGAKAAAAPDSP